MKETYLLPEIREGIRIHDVILTKYIGKSLEEEQKIFQKKTSQSVMRIRSQFLLIEKELIRTFEYVEPNYNNLKTNSIRFASIIREACNLYELVSKEVYISLFDKPVERKLNIINYLSLDKILNFHNVCLSSPYIPSMHEDKHKLFPFVELLEWDGLSKITSQLIPKWWNTYNKIKHNNDGIDCATLENALLSVGGVYVLINSIYGDGVLVGNLREYTNVDMINSIYIDYRIEDSKLFTYATIGSQSII
ncbi:hypothetical protein [Paenibacillus sp. IHBB 10380]|uniref:hypothetical protein n=1 Tax=Paenibacillus sp. IHBB 10380 TaxID=1566358 RepID=UPI0005CFD305|nr:hypothetical protein [Paenibacillus sp. IHBB 10380]AJS61180.1 hypothetical protein UB51_25180 [Paenibacillus sp. IHBB 10380]